LPVPWINSDDATGVALLTVIRWKDIYERLESAIEA
jgi:hypothetical protein